MKIWFRGVLVKIGIIGLLSLYLFENNKWCSYDFRHNTVKKICEEIENATAEIIIHADGIIHAKWKESKIFLFLNRQICRKI